MKPKAAQQALHPQETESFIDRYIRQRVADYQEPKRAGTRKGDKIGFSRTKYQAALLTGLTDLEPKAVSMRCGVSYGVLATWKTHEDFWSVVEREQKDLAEELIKETDIQLNSEDFAKIRIPGVNEQPLNPSLAIAIAQSIEMRAAGLFGEPYKLTQVAEILKLGIIKERLVSPEPYLDDPMQNPVFDAVYASFGAAIEVIEQKRTSQEERDAAVMLLRYLKRLVFDREESRRAILSHRATTPGRAGKKKSDRRGAGGHGDE